MSSNSPTVTSVVTYQQLLTVVKKIIKPVSPYTKEPLELKWWNKTYYLHEYLPSRKWRYSEYGDKASLSMAIYRFKNQEDSELEFELLWAIMQVCKDIPEDNILLFNVPSSSGGCIDTPIVKLIRQLGEAPSTSVFVSFMKELFCKGKRFIDCSGAIIRSIPIISNHERAGRNIKRATFEEQVNSMDCSEEFTEYADSLSKDNESAACLIIDDIMTSGCTINATLTTLGHQAWKFNAASSIYKLVLARTVYG